MAEAEGRKLGRNAAAELLGDWRAAERDLAAAKESASTADLAAEAAKEAVVAADETSDAARLSGEAAHRAEQSAKRTAAAAEMTSRAARNDQGVAADALERAVQAETAAGDRFREAQRQGFDQEPPKPEGDEEAQA